jgi:hypothetical protein
LPDEAEPKWTSSIRISGLDEAEAILDEYKSVIAFQEGVIAKLKGHYRLLYSHGAPLQDAVKTALKILDLDDCRKEKQGLIFDFQHTKSYAHGAIGVLGSEEKASIAQLKHCQELADSIGGKKSKPVFIVNQLRSSPYPESSRERMTLGKAENDYTRQKKICVIPTFVLFEAVNKALKGYKSRRPDLEKLIAETNGVLADFG